MYQSIILVYQSVRRQISLVTPHAKLHKQHNAQFFHRAREAIAAKIIGFYHTAGGYTQYALGSQPSMATAPMCHILERRYNGLGRRKIWRLHTSRSCGVSSFINYWSQVTDIHGSRVSLERRSCATLKHFSKDRLFYKTKHLQNI